MIAKSKRTKPISEKKLKTVSELENLIKNNKTFMVCSIKNLPGKQFQEIKKKIKENAKIKVPKKNIIYKAIDNSGIEIKKLKENITEDYALLFSQSDLFELSAILSESKTPIQARVGQIANENIEIEPGPTDLIPGPIISELGILGLKIAIEDGKINIKEKKIIVKVGEKINGVAASIMSKLGIKPFSIGFEPLAGYDSQEKKIYRDIKVDRAKIIEKLKKSFSKAKAFAVGLAYPCNETISLLLGKALMQEKAISKLIKSEEKQNE